MGKLVFVKTTESLGIEEFVVPAGDEARMTLDAGDQTSTVTGHWEPEI